MARQSKRPSLTHAKVTATSHPSAPWRVAYDAERDGKKIRLRRMFASEDRAWMFAEERDRETKDHGLRYGDIPPEVRRAFDFFRDRSAELREQGAVVPPFEQLVAASLAHIADRLARAAESHTSIAEAVAAFLRSKAGGVGVLHMEGLKTQLTRFARAFGDRPMATVEADEIEAWLDGLESRYNPSKLSPPPLVSAVTRNAYRGSLHSLFAYAAAKSRAWVPFNPIAEIAPDKENRGDPEAYSPADAALIMQAALDHNPALVPVLALGMFAGLRASEAEIFDLSKLTPETTEFRVASTKTGPRIVPFTDSCKAWLFAQPRRKGRAWPGESRDKDTAMLELYGVAKVTRILNGFRHSFISYRCADIRDVGRVADESGNSPGMIKKHYREIVTAAAAVTYFGIRPRAEAENITGIEAGRASA